MTAAATAVGQPTFGTVRSRTALAVAAWAVLIGVAVVWGRHVNAAQPEDPHVGAVPLFGRWDLVETWRLVSPLAAAVTAVVLLPRWCAQLPWRRMLLVAAAAAALWTLALGVVDGDDVLTHSVEADYGEHIDLVDAAGPGGFLHDYVGEQSGFPTHLQSHPPGLVVTLWAADRIGLHGEAFHVAVELLAVSMAVGAALVILADLAGAGAARVAAPLVALAPAAVWHTNADVIYAGVSLAGLALVVRGIVRSDPRLAAAGGAVFGLALLLTYGVALLVVPMAIVAVAHHRVRSALLAGLAAAAVVVAPLAWGFWWFDGLRATKDQYDLNLVRVRPYYYWVVGNLAAMAFAVGPAVAVGLAWLRDRRAWLAVGGGLATIALADLSGLANAETERIWQPFVPLALLGAAGLAAVPARQRTCWLAAQVAFAIGLQAVLRSPW